MDTRVRRARRIDAQDLFVQTLEQWADAVVVIDDQSRVLFINAAAERFWGCPRQDVVGSHVDTLFPETLLTADDPGSSRDLSILGKDGQMRWATLSVSRITQKGRPLHVAFLKDITQTRLQDIEHACCRSRSMPPARPPASSTRLRAWSTSTMGCCNCWATAAKKSLGCRR